MKTNQPLLLEPFNVVALARTPWAGDKIYKLLRTATVDTSTRESKRVGECWEFSCDPNYPSRIKGTDTSISELIAADPNAMLSRALVAKNGKRCQLMVKLINAVRPLSLQVHPRISPDQPYDGKWESWLVLAAEREARAYIGFARSTSHEQILEKIIRQQDMRPLLGILPLRRFDYLDIEPCTPHALGAGAVILEVQYLLHGEGGKTLRLWDWGSERRLDTLAALREITPHQQWGQQYIDSKRATGQCWANKYYRTKLLNFSAQQEFALDIEHYGIVLCMAGNMSINSVPVCGYQPLFLPAAITRPVRVQTDSAGYLVVIEPV